jgi:hypothetical protein
VRADEAGNVANKQSRVRVSFDDRCKSRFHN